MADEQATTDAKAGKKSPLKLLIVGLGALLLIGGGAAGAVMFFRGDGGGGSADGAALAEVSTETLPAGALPTFGHIMSIEEFTVNLNETSGSRYLQVKINLELEQESLEPEIEERMPVIRDTILLLLSGLDFEDISTPEGKQALKEAIKLRIEQILRAGVVRQVLFEDFLVQ
jgi:flagellar FliL protein